MARVWSDLAIGAGLALGAFALYFATLLPGLGSRDTAELQWVVPTLGLAHPTGYPLYTILGWLWCQLPLGGTPAWRMNLFSAFAAALAIGTVYQAARAIGQARLVAAAAALALATSLTFWSQATIAEVYGLAALLQALLILALLRWRAGVWPLWPIGLLVGLGLAHHRSVVLMLPGALAFMLIFEKGGLEGPRPSKNLFSGRSRPHSGPRPARKLGARGAQPLALTAFQTASKPSVAKKDLALALAGLLAGCLLYVYVPLRAPAWMQTWQQVWEHISGAGLTASWLDPARLRAEGASRLLDLARRFVWPQLLPLGAILALLGAARLLLRDRGLAALLALSYLVVFGFCAAYYVADVEVFFIPAHLLAALLLGEGAMALVRLVPFVRPATDNRRSTTNDQPRPQTLAPWSFVLGRSSLVVRPWSFVGIGLLALPVLLLARNLAPVQALNSRDDERVARAIMAQPLPPGALVVGNWFSTEGPRYLQAIEGVRPDVQLGVGVSVDAIRQALDHGRAVYLAEPDLSLGLEQWPEGQLWRLGNRPIAAATPADIRWDGGVALAGYTLRPGPYAQADKVGLVLQWQALDAPRRAYTLFVHLVAADGTIWGQADMQPAQASTDQWRPGSRYSDLVSLALKPGAPPGRYRVTLGWYEYPSMARLSLADGRDYVTLGEVEVTP